MGTALAVLFAFFHAGVATDGREKGEEEDGEKTAMDGRWKKHASHQLPFDGDDTLLSMFDEPNEHPDERPSDSGHAGAGEIR